MPTRDIFSGDILFRTLTYSLRHKSVPAGSDIFSEHRMLLKFKLLSITSVRLVVVNFVDGHITDWPTDNGNKQAETLYVCFELRCYEYCSPVVQ